MFTTIRSAEPKDLNRILDIYNEGIIDRIATLETEVKDFSFIQDYFYERCKRHPLIILTNKENVIGWASLNPYSTRSVYDEVATLSIYIGREYRGKGYGKLLMQDIEKRSRTLIRKIILNTFPFNSTGQNLYKSMGYREVGVYKDQGYLDGKYVDVMIMEKIL
ncbi:arsinothricin resistance N-acetyltransferase ArsN1 family A [Shouchella sp. 1P09AA]|uniref:arsinothricin resistance N-acetyltransferase ArsN1 family A n=1 Tax=Bacillaceae TaxID=186817 RepID=UPI0034E96C05